MTKLGYVVQNALGVTKAPQPVRPTQPPPDRVVTCAQADFAFGLWPILVKQKVICRSDLTAKECCSSFFGPGARPVF